MFSSRCCCWCWCWCCSLWYSTKFFPYPPNWTKLNLTFIWTKKKLSEQTLPHNWCFKIDWNIAKWQKENISESESGGQMALTFTRRKRDKNVFLPDNIKCCTSFCLSQHNLNPIQYKSIRDSARFIYCHSFNFLSSQYPSWKISVLFLYLFLVYPDSVFSSPN